SLHPGVSPDDVREATSFEVHRLDEAGTSRLPSEDELRLIRDIIDPKGLRNKEIRI
ncbi:MAG: CoA-transferase, partial [Mycobacterium sp.]|nr:CoA-transferase [Mycobacterium sp.]